MKLCHLLRMKIVITVLITLMLTSIAVSANAVTYTYDKLHRLTSATYENGIKLTYTYDAAGNILTAQSTNVNTVHYHVYGDVLLNGIGKDGATVGIIGINGNNISYTGSYASTTDTVCGKVYVGDSSNGSDRISYFFDVPVGTYTINVTNGNQSATATVTTNSSTTQNLGYGTYYMQGVGDVALPTENNVTLAVGLITAPIDPVKVNTAITASASFTDPGTIDTHTAVWNWGDDTTSPGTITETDGSGSVDGSHTYTAAGMYTITLTVTDKDGGTGSSTFDYVVVYNPDGGFVTGGGSINLPVGAYAADPSTTGVATFGFVSKYQKGASVPKGSTEFQFKDGNLNFHSTSYDWLVISDRKTQYKGSGTINGKGDYGFILTAIDGQYSGGTDPDMFRMKITNKADGSVVFDNQMKAADDTDPTTVTSGGNIVIHK